MRGENLEIQKFKGDYFKPLIIASAGMYTYGCFMTEEQEKVTGWTIDMHLVIDEQGKVKVTQDLLDAFRVRRGDMLSFHFDTTQDIVTVTGSRTPPNFHSELQVKITPITRGMSTQLSVS